MNTSIIENQVVNFLSNITGTNMSQRDVKPPVIFVANLIVLLLGVMFVDGIVTNAEKQKLIEILNRFNTPENDVCKFAYCMIKGAKKYQLYRHFNKILTIINPLSESERLLLLGFCCEMSTVDGKIDGRKQKYLEIVAQYLNIKQQHLAVLLSAFKPQDNFQIAILDEVDSLLDSVRLQHINTGVISSYPDNLTTRPANSKTTADMAIDLAVVNEVDRLLSSTRSPEINTGVISPYPDNLTTRPTNSKTTADMAIDLAVVNEVDRLLSSTHSPKINTGVISPYPDNLTTRPANSNTKTTYDIKVVNEVDGLVNLARFQEINTGVISPHPDNLTTRPANSNTKTTYNIKVVNEVDGLVDSARFQEINTHVIPGYSENLTTLPPNSKNKTNQPRVSIYYGGFKKFQELNKQLSNYSEQILQIIQTCHELGFLRKDLIDEVTALSIKVQSHRFRLAIIGEFSQGKSTLLNALLGEEIQPMREIPCSGTVVVLKHGQQKRVVCRYKDGSEEEILLDDYRNKASISEDVAIGFLNEDIAKSRIEEIIIEHSSLTLCNSGVEIIDSPGLNENPELTTITQRLLQDIDAAIFVTNASRPLTQSERELLNQLRIQLNGGKEEEPANNLFIVGNFMDLVNTEQGRQQVKKRICNFVEGQQPIIKGKNRVHFISAKAALNAFLNESQNEYQKDFDNFIKSIENFLMSECGGLKLQQLSAQFNKMIQEIISELEQSKNSLQLQTKMAEHEKHNILERIGELSGRDVKISLLTIQIIEQALEKANVFWNEWYDNLDERMVLKIEHWHSEHRLIWNQDKLIRDYVQCFVIDLSDEIDDWVNHQLKNTILREGLQELNIHIKCELDALITNFNSLDLSNNTRLSEDIKFSINDMTNQLIELDNVDFSLDNVDFSATLQEKLLGVTGMGFIPVALANVTAIIASSFGSSLLDTDRFYHQIKMSVLETQLQKLDESIDKVYKKLQENIEIFFDAKVESVSRIIEKAISVYEKLLEQQEKSYQEMLNEHHVTKLLIMHNCQELEQINSRISADIALWYSEVIIKKKYD